MTHQRMPEEEPRIESAHIPVTYTPSIDHIILLHFLPPRLRLILIDVIRLVPMLMRNYPKLHLALLVHDVAQTFLKLRGERHLVEENVGVSVSVVEPILNFANAADGRRQIRVSAEDDEGGVGELWGGGECVDVGFFV